MSIYTDHSWKGVTYGWHNTAILDSMITYRGTHVEMIQRPEWGIACYMDNAIQSCEIDEALYHESLVHPVMSSVDSPKRVMIIGGGEGATAREVLKYKTVECVDMYEWDKDVVQLFQSKYPQWAKGAWDDPRLHLYHDDIFKTIEEYPVGRYDVIIIDLFDPSVETYDSWKHLLQHIDKWIQPTGSIVMYSGIRERTSSEQPYEMLGNIIMNLSGDLNTHLVFKQYMVPYHVFVPSFLGESTFLLLCPTPDFKIDRSINSIGSHVTDLVWKSYQTFNW
jgi:spermidine synthase